MNGYLISLVVLAALFLLFPWIYLTLFKQNITRTTMKFRLFGSGLFDKRFSEILRAFLTGNNRMLKMGLQVNREREYLDIAFDPFYRGFAFEGAGMGLGARCAMFGGGEKFEQLMMKLSPKYVYQYYVGLGWYLHIRYGYKPQGYNQWISQLDPRFAPILFDGVGFKTGLFSKLGSLEAVSCFGSFTSEQARICLQGYGRSLWFQNRFNLQNAVMEINKQTFSDRDDLYSGLGLAVAYSFFDNMAYALSMYRLVPALHQAAFAQGVAFGWEARRLQHQDTWEETLDKYSSAISANIRLWISHIHQAKVIAIQVEPQQFYTRWMDLTRHYIQFRTREQVAP
jgi:hypothetical protein